MSDAAARTQRASALEEKRRRLDDLKKRREVRGNDAARIQATANLDEYIDDLLKETPATTSEAPPFSASSNVVNVISDSRADVTPNDNDGEPVTSVISKTASPATPSDVPLLKMVETFSISTQTEAEFLLTSVDADDDEDDERKEKLKTEEKVEANVNEGVVSAEKREPVILSPQEVEKEVSKEPFSLFINAASKKLERVLGTPFSDLLVDYVAETADRDTMTQTNSREQEDIAFVQSRQLYECPKWTAHRDVTDLDWSPIHRELLLSTYHLSSASSSATAVKGQVAVSSMIPSQDTLSSSLTPRSGDLLSDGLALIWSPLLPNRPEHIFTCGSPVTTGRFHPTDAALIIGGCESGQLVIWDIRSGRLPVQKSSLPSVSSTSRGHHAHAIGTMQLLDGGVCPNFGNKMKF
jgi:WD40 repeat protein